MPRFNVIREGTRSAVADPFGETGWYVLDDDGTLTYHSLLDTHQAEREAHLAAWRRSEPNDANIFEYLDTNGGDAYFMLLSIPEVHQAASLDDLVQQLKRAQNTR